MDEYIRLLTEQIRCEKARAGVAKEIKDHIEDQTEYYEVHGMEHDEAVKEAVRQMGDPVVAGVELDRVHRPQINLRLMILVIGLNLIGVLVQAMTRYSAMAGFSVRLDGFKFVTAVTANDLGSVNEMIRFFTEKQLQYVLIGTIIMIGIQFIDYSIIGKYAKQIFMIYIVLLFFIGNQDYIVRGMRSYLSMPIYLLLPVFAGILYQHRKQNFWGIVKSMAYIIPVVIICRMLSINIPIVFNFYFVICGMLVVAIRHDWFDIKKKFGYMYIAGIVLLPVITFILWLFFGAAEYQKIRVLALLQPQDYKYGAGYINTNIKNILSSSQLIGGSGNLNIGNNLDYIFVQMISSYGILCVALILIAISVVIVKIFKISSKQKNQLGMMIGSGFGMLIVLMVAEGFGMNFGFFPGTSGILYPFLTYGKSATIGYSVFLGLILSIYRYQNVLTDENEYKPKWILDIKVRKMTN